MTDYELQKEFEKINEKLTTIYHDRGHFLIIVLLIILFIRGC